LNHPRKSTRDEGQFTLPCANHPALSSHITCVNHKRPHSRPLWQYIPFTLSANLQQLTMPFIPHTPESLLPRSDSKNPASTCRGLTSNGRPCRRSISRSPSPYCWQHKDQTPQIQPTIKERTSTDTLVDRLGILEISPRKQEQKRKRPQKRKPSNLALFCCIGEASETSAPRPARPPISRDPPSRTKEFLSLIPKSTSPQTTAILLAELAKPVSEFDDEGFIYIFWLTPETYAAPTETAQSLLTPSRPQPGHRRTSEVISTFANEKKTILLKIGRAANVQKRLNQWTRQCGYNVSLVRYYPYHTSSSTSVNKIPSSPRKVPNAHKVERLIHIELSGKRAQGSGKCAACGREHREWFEVEASRAGVKAVDAVVKRWVTWGERVAVK